MGYTFHWRRSYGHLHTDTQYLHAHIPDDTRLMRHILRTMAYIPCIFKHYSVLTNDHIIFITFIGGSRFQGQAEGGAGQAQGDAAEGCRQGTPR